MEADDLDGRASSTATVDGALADSNLRYEFDQFAARLASSAPPPVISLVGRALADVHEKRAPLPADVTAALCCVLAYVDAWLHLTRFDIGAGSFPFHSVSNFVRLSRFSSLETLSLIRRLVLV